jgi:hypothetical protein
VILALLPEIVLPDDLVLDQFIRARITTFPLPLNGPRAIVRDLQARICSSRAEVLSLQGAESVTIDSTRGFVLSFESPIETFVYDVRGLH